MRKSYRLNWGARVFCLLAAVACVVAGWFLYRHSIAGSWNDVLEIRMGAAALAVLGCYICMAVFLHRIVLDDVSVTAKRVFRTSSLRRDAVKGQRTIRNRNGSYLILEGKEGAGVSLVVSDYYNFGAEWHEWVGSLVDLDKLEASAAHPQALAQEKAAAKELRQKRLARARSIAISLSILSFVAGVPLWIYGGELDATAFRAIDLLAMVLPWVVIGMEAHWPSHYSLMPARNDPRPSLIVVLFGAGVCLMASPYENFQVDSTTNLLLFSLVPALGLAGALYRAAPRSPRPLVSFLGLLAISIFYGYGVCSQINAQTDISAPHQLSTPVVGKTAHNGRSVSYHLFLKPWLPGQGTQDLDVGQPFYDAVKVGDAVCIVARDGALHAAWHTVQVCK
jgi:hypothetical protein